MHLLTPEISLAVYPQAGQTDPSAVPLLLAWERSKWQSGATV